MSSRSVREFLSLALMAAMLFAVFYVNTALIYKVYMVVLVFAIVILLGIADEAVRQLEERNPNAQIKT